MSAGYMVGREYERGGIVKHGSQMVNALSNSTVPHITVIMGASYGAGNYGMGGRAFDHPLHLPVGPRPKIAVMGPKAMAGVMSHRAADQRHGGARQSTRQKEAAMTKAVEEVAEAQSLGLYASGRVVDDGMIDPRDTRTVVPWRSPLATVRP